MSLTDLEREKVDALKRREIFLRNRAEKYRIIELAEKEFSGRELEPEELDELANLSTEDRTTVDLAKLDLQAEEDTKLREEELLAIALLELE